MTTIITWEEQQLMALHNIAGTREGLIADLEKMLPELQPDETELRELTESALGKLRKMSDEDFLDLDLIPDFV